MKLDETHHRMDGQGFFKLAIPEKLNMARLIIDYWAEHGRANDVAICYLGQRSRMAQLGLFSLHFASLIHDPTH
jgi:hypothetical protein